jgi:glutathione S-transferase
MLIVYEHNESVCCQKVRIVLSEKQIPHKVINVSFEKRENHSPEFEAVNPKGKVPVIVHDGRTITESTVIIEYLDEAFPGPNLMPKDPYWRARRQLWARWIDDEMHIPHISTLSFNISMTHLLGYKKDLHAQGVRGAPPAFMFVGIESKEMLASLQAYKRFLREMDRTLADNPWLAGPEYSLADIDVVPYIWRLRNLHLFGMWDDMPRIQDWLDRVSSRDSFREQIMGTELPEWVNSMRGRGKEAWPTIEQMLKTSEPVLKNPFAINDHVRA